MKKILMIISLIGLIVVLCACGEKEEKKVKPIEEIKEIEQIEEIEKENEVEILDDNEKEAETELEEKSEEENVTPTSNESIKLDSTVSSTNARYASANNPITSNETGIVELYSSDSKNYDKVYVKVTDILSTDLGRKIIEDYNNDENHVVHYNVDFDQFDVHVIKILVDLKDYHIPEWGIYKLIMSADVRSMNDDNTYGEVRMIGAQPLITKVDESVEKYAQGDVAELYVAYSLPKGFSGKHMLRFSNSFESENKYTYFLIEK